MKKLLKIVTPLFFFILISGCTNDNDLKRFDNNMTLDSSSFRIIKGMILGVSIGDSGHTAITLISGTTTEVKTLTLDIPTFTEEAVPGTYTYPQQNGKELLNDWLTNYMYFINGSAMSTNLQSGTATITHNTDNNYTVTVDLTMKNGMIFKGTYSGDFQVQFQNN